MRHFLVDSWSACEKKTGCDSVFSSGNGLRYSAFLAQYRVSIDFSVNVQLRRSRGTLICRYEFVKRTWKRVTARIAGLLRDRGKGRSLQHLLWLVKRRRTDDKADVKRFVVTTRERVFKAILMIQRSTFHMFWSYKRTHGTTTLIVTLWFANRARQYSMSAFLIAHVLPC